MEPITSEVLGASKNKISGKHASDNYHLLEKFVQNLQQLLCTFCKSIGHDERNCGSYELMMEQTLTYRMKVENKPQD